jgi:hypothetical protein
MINFLIAYFHLGLGEVAAALSIFNGANSLFGGSDGGGGGGGSSNAYIPKGQSQADDQFLQLLTQLTGGNQDMMKTLMPYLQQAFGGTSDLYGRLQGTMEGDSSLMRGQSGNLFGAGDKERAVGDQLWTMGRDPQGALHDKLQNQVVDASRASTSARGIGMSPQSAGMEDSAVSNFNMDWNNQALQRALQGAGGMGAAYADAGRQTGAGTDMLIGSDKMTQGAGQLPFDAAKLFSGGAAGAMGPSNDVMSQILKYLGYGGSQTDQRFGQQQAGMSNMTSGLDSLGKLLKNGFGGGSTTPDPGGGGGGDGSAGFGGFG